MFRKENLAASKSGISGYAAWGCSTLFGGVWILGWSMVTLIFDGVLTYTLTMQLAAFSYDTTEGTIITSQVETGTDSDGDSTYAPQVNYAYDVQGVRYESDLRRYTTISTNNRESAEAMVAALPPGKLVPVYYRRSNPQHAVLVRGLEGMDLMMGLFLTPFNVIMLGSWWFAWSWLRPKDPDAIPYGVRVRDDGLTCRLTICQPSPLVAAAGAAAGAAFVMTFVVGFGQVVLPFFELAVMGWIVVGLIAVWTYRVAKRSATELVIDSLSSRLEVRKISSVAPSQPVNFADIRTIELDVQETSTSDDEPRSKFLPVIVLHKSPTTKMDDQSTIGDRVPIYPLSDRAAAEWVLRFLQTKLRTNIDSSSTGS